MVRLNHAERQLLRWWLEAAASREAPYPALLVAADGCLDACIEAAAQLPGEDRHSFIREVFAHLEPTGAFGERLATLLAPPALDCPAVPTLTAAPRWRGEGADMDSLLVRVVEAAVARRTRWVASPIRTDLATLRAVHQALVGASLDATSGSRDQFVAAIRRTIPSVEGAE